MSLITLPAWPEVAAELGSIRRLLVGFSGGLDSTVLLYLARQWSAQSGLPVLAIHVNHQLSPNALHWQTHCRNVCEQWGIPFHTEVVSVANTGQGLEAAARNARYEVFTRQAVDGDLLLLGHHLDDQFETVMLRLLRGSGVLGMRGMERFTAWGSLPLLRPLLSFTKSELQEFACAQRDTMKAWQWVEDESNTSDRFDRNFLRNQVLPLLQTRWPQATQAVERTTQHCTEAQQLLDERAHDDLLPRIHEDGGLLLINELLSPLSPARQRNLLRYWLRRQQVSLPSESQLNEILQQMTLAADDAMPEVQWGSVAIHRFRQRLYAVPLFPPLPPDYSLTLPALQLITKSVAANHASEQAFESHHNERVAIHNSVAGSFTNASSEIHSAVAELYAGENHPLPSGGKLQLHLLQAGLQPGVHALRLSYLSLISIRFRQGGETCKLVGRPTRPLKKILQESALPPWWRERLPLIYIEDTLAVVPGIGVCDGFQAHSGETGLAIDWQPPMLPQGWRDPACTR